jgi:uncharacterized membrane protein YphA (DoxX/SURF4 family)
MNNKDDIIFWLTIVGAFTLIAPLAILAGYTREPRSLLIITIGIGAFLFLLSTWLWLGIRFIRLRNQPHMQEDV